MLASVCSMTNVSSFQLPDDASRSRIFINTILHFLLHSSNQGFIIIVHEVTESYGFKSALSLAMNFHGMTGT